MFVLRTIVFLAFFPTFFAWGQNQDLPENAQEQLIKHLYKQGFNQLVVSHLGESLVDDSEYAFSQVICRYEISRCRVVYRKKSGSSAYKNFSIWFRVESPRLGWRAIANISKGTEISITNIEWGMTDAIPCLSHLALKENLLLGKFLSRELKAGDALCLHDLEASNDVNKNHIVKLISRTSGFDLAVSAKSLQSGNIGDVVKVRIPGSANVLQAIVIGKQQVELSL